MSGFYDHMLASLAKHALFDLTVQATGDTHVDAHHTVEDVAIVLGEALREALGDKVGHRPVRRRARSRWTRRWCRPWWTSAVGPYCVHTGEAEGQQYVLIGGQYVGSLTRHVFETLAHHAAHRAARAGAVAAATRTTWWRPSSRRSPGRCAPPSRRTRGSAACPAPRACCEPRPPIERAP